MHKEENECSVRIGERDEIFEVCRLRGSENFVSER